MEQAVSGPRRRSDGSVRECLFFPVLERNEQERLEALLRRSLERSLQLDHRPKRWTWGGPTPTTGQEDHCKNTLITLSADSDFPNNFDASLPATSQSDNAAHSVPVAAGTLSQSSDPQIRKRLASSPAATDYTERASPSPHGSPSRAPWSLDHGKTSSASQGSSKESGGAIMAPETGQKEILGRARGAVSLVTSVPARRAESPAMPARSFSPRAQSKPRRIRSSNGRAQSPCTVGQYPPFPIRHGATTPGTNNNKLEEEEKGTRDFRGSLERKTLKANTPERKVPKSSSRDLSVDRSAEPSPVTPTGKPVAGTTDAEEASRLLAERRRQARLQKELQEEEERVRAEELRMRQAEEHARQEEEARWAGEERERQEQERRRSEDEERRQREHRWIELQAQLEREREETEQRARKEAERHRQERELMKLQEEQERLQRKKRIEEIMKRTRKGDAQVKKEAVWVEPPSHVSFLHSQPSPLLGSRDAVQVNGQSTWMKLNTPPFAPPPVRPLITLGPLEVRCCGMDEFPDEVQSMDVSPVSKEDLVSIPEFSPVDEVHPIDTSSTCALEDLLDLTGQVCYPKLLPAVALAQHPVSRMLELGRGTRRCFHQHPHWEKSAVWTSAQRQ
ncbi:hypothetical protein AAFF_G00354880 [Aldrovandia affinis]|uniref:Uncharacterized protein n=1 Tax=Aldrovandia affinis TaxID=143900 RepID=A0AAD7WN79_9TELE|nr:hypothetical protein AAFF_G00354880 [Aldrovandia affinis]